MPGTRIANSPDPQEQQEEQAGSGRHLPVEQPLPQSFSLPFPAGGYTLSEMGNVELGGHPDIRY